MKLIIFIKGFNLKDHTEWGGPNMVFMTPAHILDCLISLSQSRHHICINCGVSASGGMGLARRMAVHVQFSSRCHIWRTCDVTSLSKTVLTKKCLKQNGKGLLGVATMCFLTYPVSTSQTWSMKLYVPVVPSWTWPTGYPTSLPACAWTAWGQLNACYLKG